MKNRVYAACDIGSSKVACGIARIDENDQFALVGFGESESKGLKKGVVINIETAVKNIKTAVSDAEVMSGNNIEELIINVGGDHLSGTNSNGVVAVSGRNNEISREDVNRVIDAARTIVVPKGREIIHVLEQEYIVDDQAGIKEPIGMSGIRLESSVHLVTGSVSLIKNLKSAISRASYGFTDIILSGLASAEACLSPDEKELGVLLVDIGSETTDIICWFNNSVYFTDILPWGGSNITKDIAIMLKMPIKEAENIKVHSGIALASMVDEDQKIEIPAIGANQGRLESKRFLSEVIEARLKDLFQEVLVRIKKGNLEKMIPSGIVLTGGGALLSGIENFVFDYLKIPVRIGYPFGFKSVEEKIFSPRYSTLIGLLMLVKSSEKEQDGGGEKRGFIESLKRLFKGY